jgi:AAA domain/Winged helix-turn-helix DNA-binding
MDNLQNISPDFAAEDKFLKALQAGALEGPPNGQDETLFTVKPANSWIDDAKTRPIPRMLFSEFWFEGELCILFSDTNLGKSIAAVQIGDSITTGQPINGFKMEAQKQKVLYFDFELSDKQFELRYSDNYQSHYHFNEYFFRAEINPEKSDYSQYGSFEKYLYVSLEEAIKRTGSKIVIIDNITYLKEETERARFALPLMKHLQGLKKKFGLSILCLAHTPKRDLSKPLTRNDLQGSKMLINFCDSAFAIGESNTDSQVRYFKQIKVRNCRHIYDSENVITCQVGKAFNFLSFEFLQFSREREHLKQQTDKDRTEMIQKVKEMAKNGISQREIAKELNISLGAVNKYVHLFTAQSA